MIQASNTANNVTWLGLFGNLLLTAVRVVDNTVKGMFSASEAADKEGVGKIMSNFNDLLNDIGNKNASALAEAGDIIGTFGDFTGDIVNIVNFLQLVGLISSQDNQIQQVLHAIYDLKRQIAAEDTLQWMRDLDSAIIDAVTAFAALPANLDPAVPPLSQDEKREQIDSCIKSVSLFTDEVSDARWLRVWADLSYYSDSWSGTLAPQPGSDGNVFYYTYTLPQFLRVIYILLTVIGAYDPVLLNDYQSTLKACADRLEWVYNMILYRNPVPVPGAEFVGTKLPTPAEVGEVVQVSHWSHSETTYTPSYRSAWYEASPPHLSYGAVEVYSGVNNVGSYADYMPAGDVVMATPTFVNFSSLLQLRILQRKKALYNQLGMPVVRQVINQLKQLAGEPLLTDPPYEAWSVGEVFSTLGIPLPTDFSSVEPALATFLQGTPPYTSFSVFSFDPKKQHYNPHDPSTYEKQVPGLPLPTVPLFYFLTGTYVPHGGSSTTLSSYVWPDSSQQHVLFVGTQTVQELWWFTTAPSQRYYDNLMSTGAPYASTNSVLSGYVWPDGSSQHVFYGDTAGVVHELLWTGDPPSWHNGDLVDNTFIKAQVGGYSSYATALSSYVWPDGSSQHVFYVGTDGRVHELLWTGDPPSWHNGDLVDSSLIKAQAGLPSASPTALSSYVWPDGSSQHVFYVGTDGRVHELWWGPMLEAPSPSPIHPGTVPHIFWSWHKSDLVDSSLKTTLKTAQEGAPSAFATALSSYVWPDSSQQHVFYLSTDGHVHELVWHGTSGWQYAGDLMVASKHMVGPTIIGEPEAPSAATNSALSSYVWPDGSSQHVFYVGTDGRVHELWWRWPSFASLSPSPSWHNGDWADSTLKTAQARAPSASATTLSSYVRPDGREQHVFYQSADGHVHELSWDATSGWRYAGDLTT